MSTGLTMVRQSFRSFDEYAASLGHSDLRLIALRQTRAAWETSRVELDGVWVREAQDGGPCLYEVAIDGDGIGLVVGVDAAGKVTGNGTVFGPASVLVAPGRTEVRSTSLDTVRWMSVFIPASRLASTADGHCGLMHRSRVVDDGGAFQHVLARVVGAAVAGAFDGNPLGQRCAADQLVAAARSVLKDSSPRVDTHATLGRPRLPRDEVMRRIHRWLEEDRHQNPSLDDLARIGGVSDRTLHSAFLEQLGISPKRFLRLRLLNLARRELRRADPEATRVTDVLTRIGIWEWGRFARDYRTLFGELPSATLYRRSTFVA